MPSVSHRQRGMALVIVLWVLSLMTIMAGSFALSTQRETAVLHHAHERARALALAEGAVYYAMLMLNLPDQTLRWKADGRPYSWDPKGTKIRVRIQDESGKIDINVAQETTLKSAFRLIGLGDDQATAVTDAILDWRDADDIKRPNGAELPEYEARKMNSPPQNRQFLVMDEVQGIIGISPELFKKIQTWFTLYSGIDGLDPSKASEELLPALTGNDPAVIQSVLRQRKDNLPVTIPPVPGINFTQAAGVSYNIKAEVVIDGDQLFGINANVRRGSTSGNLPFTILRWRPFHNSSKPTSDPLAPDPQKLPQGSPS